MSARAPGIALALGTLLAILGAAEARAAAVCSNTPGANDWISCTQTGTADIDIDLTNPAISTTNPADEGIWAEHTGTGNIDIDVTGGSIAAADAYGVRARHEAAGAIDIDLTNVDVSTQGQLDNGVSAQHRGTSGTGIDIDVTGGSVTTVGSDSYGIYATVNDSTGVAVGAAISIDTKNTRVSTMGLRGYGVFGSLTTAASTAPLSVNVAGGSVATAGQNAHAVRAYRFSQTGTGAITVGVTDGAALSTTGVNAHGVLITQNGLAGIDADLTDAVISTANTSSYGFMGWLSNTSGSQLLDIDIVRGSVKTTGARSYGILGYVDRAASASALSIDADGVAVSTTGYRSYGFFALHLGTGSLDVDLDDVAISTTGDESVGVVGNIRNAASTAAIAIDAAGDRAIAVEGLNTAGILGLQAGLGSVGVTTGAGTAITAPFAAGMEARATNDAGAAGRVVVTHGGAAEARYAGVVALAARSSGHTMGDGAQTADDAARTEAMIAVTSSGTVTVGASVMDAFIRARIAGADETLSAAEQAVLDAVTAEDSGALNTALEALPAAYDADWKAEARNLLRKRIDEPDAARAANRAAEEILGLSRAGVRAVALSHTGMATFIRQGDRDPAILAIAAASRTEQQQTALAEQEKLSAAERTVLEAALTGSGLEAALTALSATAYTDDWKDGVRQRAASYNAGDVRVDVTGGAIDAEGNGVEALYAVPHDRNGAIAVTVADGATVTGKRNGLYVRGAGAGAGSLRAQSVTVNGAVTGGSGAGVHMAGGGRLTVGATGEIGATSGVGVLSDGAGDLHATVAGMVEGDVQARGPGALTLNVMEGGVVTGTVHDPAGPLTVMGSIGRLLYTGGGAVTVAATGRLTGVEVDGGTEALGSESGDLSLTVADKGMVTGDVQARGAGALTLNVMEGGVVTGTVHDPAGPLTVMGSIGRLLYTGGGAVTVAATGRLTGVEVDGGTEALGSESGDLSLTVADKGMVTGDVQARGASALTLNVMEGGVVTGTVHDPAGPLTVMGSIGRLLYTGGGAVTVAATGRLTGVEIDGETEALRSEAGDLDVTVAGRVTGDVLGLGDSDDHTVTVARGGTVTGAIRLAASTVRVDGTVAGYVQLDRGGTVTVGAGGRIAAAEGAGVRSEAGTLDVTVAGTVSGIDAGGDLLDAKVTDTGRAGDVGHAAGDLDLTIWAAESERPDQAADRAVGQITGTGERRIRIIAANGKELPVGPRGTSAAAPSGPFDVGIDPDGRLASDYAPRSRVYEALPSVLLGLNGTSGFHDRMAAPRSPNGVWARIEASGGSRETERSTSTPGAGLSWTERRYGAETGVDFPLETGVVGLSAHHRRASAEVSGNDGRIDVAGNGLGASMAWRLSDGAYVAGEVSATWYDVALESRRRGSLKSGVGAFGHAVGVEVGRRVDLGSGPLGALTATPRARLSYSRVGMDDFTDAVDVRVSLDKGRAATGVAGVALEASEGRSRVFGSVDVEHGFSRETVMRVSEVALSSQSEATRARFEVGGSVEWGGGRYALQGAARWATGARDYGGGMAFKVRF